MAIYRVAVYRSGITVRRTCYYYHVLLVITLFSVLPWRSPPFCEAKCKKKIIAIETKKIIPVAYPVYKKKKETYHKPPQTIIVHVPEKKKKCCCKKKHHKKRQSYGYGYDYPYYYDYVYYDYGNYGGVGGGGGVGGVNYAYG